MISLHAAAVLTALTQISVTIVKGDLCQVSSVCKTDCKTSSLSWGVTKFPSDLYLICLTSCFPYINNVHTHTAPGLPPTYAGPPTLIQQHVKLPLHPVTQTRDGMSGRDAALKQQFAEMAFFSRARNTGKMGEVVDKLKANLRSTSPLIAYGLSVNGNTALAPAHSLPRLMFS